MLEHSLPHESLPAHDAVAGNIAIVKANDAVHFAGDGLFPDRPIAISLGSIGLHFLITRGLLHDAKEIRSKAAQRR